MQPLPSGESLVVIISNRGIRIALAFTAIKACCKLRRVEGLVSSRLGVTFSTFVSGWGVEGRQCMRQP